MSIIILFTNNVLSNNLPFNSNNYSSILIIIFIFLLIYIKTISQFISIKSIIDRIDLIFTKDFIPIKNNTNKDFSGLANKINNAAERFEEKAKKYQNASRIRSQFLANATHEFKTPLFSIKGYVETLQNGAINDIKVNQVFLKKIYNQSDRLEKLFSNLIEISKIESNEIPVQLKKIFLSEIMFYLDENFTDFAKEKGLLFSIPDTKDICVYGNINLLKTCFSNLVDNAIKYSDKGSVSISVKVINNNINIKVIDSGIGILKKYHTRIFERFFRIDDSRSRLLGGSGLGLAIVKHILKAHHTDIRIESAPNQGSIFSFDLKQYKN